MTEISVVVGPGVPADAALLEEIASREFTALAVRGAVVHARDVAHLRDLVRDGDAAVVVPGPQARSLIGQPLGPEVMTWVDIERVEKIAGDGFRHIQGRGVAGLAWGIRHAFHRLHHPPALRVPYGGGLADQWAELYLPTTRAGTVSSSVSSAVSSAVPVVALVHGGYYRSIWEADLMEALCADLAGRGLAVWNLEYRRPDRHGWAATVADVAAGLAAIESADPGSDHSLDLDRIAVVGHSAGGQLALRAVADGARARLAVSLAGALDLVQGDRRGLGAGAVAVALGRAFAGDDATDELYASASPLHRAPIGVPQLIVQGTGDDLDLIDFSRRHAAAAQAAGDDVTYLEMAGNHFDVILPGTPIWQATAQAIADALA
ncbi:alpha/beta hydrolase [Nonomuraea maritima]|uniref:alpha/beta hydrolase n=1 Tax=Nonomuraea maritima TaxID=683260 RepID=UPI003716643D